MNAAQIQQSLDDGNFQLPDTTHELEVPLFIDRSNVSLLGTPGGKTTLRCYPAGMGLVIGWRRGFIGDHHHTPEGFRTHGVAHLFGRGTEFDLGPIGPYKPSDTGWRGQTRLTVHFSATSHDGSWANSYLCGIQSGEYGVWTGDQPSPWVLFWESALTLSVRTSDGVRRRFTIPADASNPILDLSITVDLETATVSASVNGVAVTVGIETADWPTGLTLSDNVHWPFSVGRLASFCNDGGWWGESHRDLTIRRMEVWTAEDRGTMVFLTEPRPATYDGGPSLPLIRTWSSYATLHLLVVHRGQGTPDMVGNVRVQDIEFREPYHNPTIVLGSVQGSVWFERLTVSGGSRAVQTSGLAVTYPLWFADCTFQQNHDRNLWIKTVATMAISRCEFKYFGRAAATLWNCNTSIRDCFVAPSGPGSVQDHVFDHWGGRGGYENVCCNYEHEPAPAVVTVTPFAPWWDYTEACEVDLARMTVGPFSPPWGVEPTRTLDAGTATVRVNATAVYLT